MPHIIRLRGPWNILKQGQETERIKLPSTWRKALGDQTGKVTLSRIFHRPPARSSGGDASDRYAVRISSPHKLQNVSINGADCSTDDLELIDLTSQIAPDNQLIITIAKADRFEQASLLEVQLEITSDEQG